MDNKEIGKRISELRKKNNMSQQDLADKLNVSNKTISKWECGNGLPDVIALNNMANIFGITLDELMNSNEPAEKAEEPVAQQPKAEKKKRPVLWTALIISVVVIVAVSSVLCFLFIPREPEILESNIFNIDSAENTLSYTVDNEVDKFSFSDTIVVPRTNTWELYYDLGGSLVVNSQTVNLQVGDNTFYIVVKNTGGSKRTYEVTIRRKPLYVVSYDTNGGDSIANEIVMEGNLATYQEPVKDGYIFDSWNFDFSTPITKDTTVTASWIPKTLTITYFANNGSEKSNVQNVTFNENATLKVPDGFTLAGHTLTGWNTKLDGSGASYDLGYSFNPYNIPSNIELYAQWEINTFALSATQNIQNAGSVSGTGTFNYGSTQTLSATTNEGYTWSGWYSKDNVLITTSQTLTVTNLDKSHEYIAKWTANQYDVTFDSNGGNEVSSSQKVTFGEGFVLPVTTRVEATFLGWFDETGKQYTNAEGISIINWDVTKATKLYAHYKINEYQVSISENLEGGSVQGEGLKEYGSRVTISATAKAGYSFKGWYNASQLVSSSSTYSFDMPNYPVTYTAKWEAITYTVTLNVNGGQALANNSKDVTFDSSFSLPVTTKSGYAFAGWYSGANGTGTQITDEAGNAKAVWSIADNATLYAKWNVVNYKITYVLNGGQNHSNNPATYNIEDANITLNYPTKAGYTFNGWVLQDASSVQKDITIAAGSTGERLYAASWVRSSQFVAISNANDLKNIANNPNGYYYLTSAIDMSGVEWKAISEFNGILDGNGHTISNITYASNESLIYCNNGTILNLHINKFYSTSSMANVGGIVYENNGLIQNCSANVDITFSCARLGLIAVQNNTNGKIIACKSTGTVKFNGTAIGFSGTPTIAGGITASNHGTIKQCYSSVDFEIKSHIYQSSLVSGISGEFNSNSVTAVIEECYFSGSIYLKRSENTAIQYVSGIATCRQTDSNMIKDCFVDATLTVDNLQYDKVGTISSRSTNFNSCYYSNNLDSTENIIISGNATNSTNFKNKTWTKTNLSFGEYINDLQFCIDDSNVWIFTENEYPKLYWEN